MLFWIQLVVYGLFGLLLSLGGINIITQPWIFAGVFLCVLVIDVTSQIRAWDKLRG